METILTKTPRFNGGQLILEPQDEYSHLELELLRTSSGLYLYLNLLFLSTNPCLEQAGNRSIEILFEGEAPSIIEAYSLAGGGRLLFSEETADRLISALLHNSSFTLRIGQRQLLVIPDNFAPLYERLLSLPIQEPLSH